MKPLHKVSPARGYVKRYLLNNHHILVPHQGTWDRTVPAWRWWARDYRSQYGARR